MTDHQTIPAGGEMKLERKECFHAAVTLAAAWLQGSMANPAITNSCEGVHLWVFRDACQQGLNAVQEMANIMGVEWVDD